MEQNEAISIIYGSFGDCFPAVAMTTQNLWEKMRPTKSSDRVAFGPEEGEMGVKQMAV
jgi:hypothetical protein